MPRPLRNAPGGLVYHALNRANARLTIFRDEADYEAFLRVLDQAVARTDMRLLAYCLMPNHFHLLLWPRGDGDLSHFMRWLTMTHTQRWHAQHRSAGVGHLYQGRFRSFPVQDDAHFLTVSRYVERNALRAGLVPQAEDWPWGSLARRAAPKPARAVAPPLSDWPIPRPRAWVARVNTPQTRAEEQSLQTSLDRGRPFGDSDWQAQTAQRLGLESTLKPIGRPSKSPPSGS
jgi:putative transposase